MKLEYTKEFLEENATLEKHRAKMVTEFEELCGMSTLDAYRTYDDDYAPRTTNLEQLKHAGYTPNGCLEDLMNALNFINVYIADNGGLDDQALYDTLVNKVLLESVPKIPLCVGYTDYIQVNGE